jgi:hypothetical protein
MASQILYISDRGLLGLIITDSYYFCKRRQCHLQCVQLLTFYVHSDVPGTLLNILEYKNSNLLECYTMSASVPDFLTFKTKTLSLFTSRHGVICQKNWTFRNAAARTQKHPVFLNFIIYKWFQFCQQRTRTLFGWQVTGYLQARKTTNNVGTGNVQIVTLFFLMKYSFEENARQTGVLLLCKFHLFDQRITNFQYTFWNVQKWKKYGWIEETN